MFPYPCDQMSDSFANIGRICITQTCKLIYGIGHRGHRGMALQGLNNNRIIGLNLNVTILNSLQLKY